jgi:hypothetical protein
MATISLNLRTVVSVYLIVCDQTFGPDLRTSINSRTAYSVQYIVLPVAFVIVLMDEVAEYDLKVFMSHVRFELF